MLNRNSLCILLLLLSCCGIISSCTKDTKQDPTGTPCNFCNCDSLVNLYQNLPALTDSHAIVSLLQQKWELKCIKYTSKYGDVSYYPYDTTRVLSVAFTDTNYTYAQNDSVLFTNPYFITAGTLQSMGGSFYYGILGSSSVTLQDSVIGISTVYPFTGSYYLLFQRK